MMGTTVLEASPFYLVSWAHKSLKLRLLVASTSYHTFISSNFCVNSTAR